LVAAKESARVALSMGRGTSISVFDGFGSEDSGVIDPSVVEVCNQVNNGSQSTRGRGSIRLSIKASVQVGCATGVLRKVATSRKALRFGSSAKAVITRLEIGIFLIHNF
jgi:hypothetical protein